MLHFNIKNSYIELVEILALLLYKKEVIIMSIRDYLIDELKRLNRMNDLLEKRINQGQAVNNEPEQIVCNINAMCEIAKIIY